MTKTSHIHPHAWRVLIGSPPASPANPAAPPSRPTLAPTAGAIAFTAARAALRFADRGMVRALRIADIHGPHFPADAIDPAMDARKKAPHPTP
ncbi:hypothetical protein ACOTJG_25865 [Achromobacter xylosoxidans]